MAVLPSTFATRYVADSLLHADRMVTVVLGSAQQGDGELDTGTAGGSCGGGGGGIVHGSSHLWATDTLDHNDASSFALACVAERYTRLVGLAPGATMMLYSPPPNSLITHRWLAPAVSHSLTVLPSLLGERYRRSSASLPDATVIV